VLTNFVPPTFSARLFLTLPLLIAIENSLGNIGVSKGSLPVKNQWSFLTTAVVAVSLAGSRIWYFSI
jgi:hypothetical protein